MPRDALRESHTGIVLNDRSSKMERRLEAALRLLQNDIQQRRNVGVTLEKSILLSAIVDAMNRDFGESTGIEFSKATTKVTSIKPDGGFLYIETAAGRKLCVLVAEAKRQGTNVDRLLAGLARQAQGNAIERLRKNMQGVDCLFATEDITPFICFGEGCDFDAATSSIMDRVSTMNSFFPLNVVHVRKIRITVPIVEVFKPVSLFFREGPWSPQEMLGPLTDVAGQALDYYSQKYGDLKKPI